MSLTFFNLRRRQAAEAQLQKENELKQQEEVTSNKPLKKVAKGVKKDVTNKWVLKSKIS